MSDGGVGNGTDFWATFKITSKLTKEQLKAVTKEVRNILNAKVTNSVPPKVNRDSDDGDLIRGEVVHAARLSNTADPQVSVTLQAAKSK